MSSKVTRCDMDCFHCKFGPNNPPCNTNHPTPFEKAQYSLRKQPQKDGGMDLRYRKLG